MGALDLEGKIAVVKPARSSTFSPLQRDAAENEPSPLL
ncbi:hypothetical protein JOC86_003787 [Bacillus pakistanensis]|uniref:Uncharacterized protein n=1 Tax=Rossellomorea pakistanensis TaxID=992288 RepID=A0ABS2NH82_9BACI|nr:hypothetical protein [Bacillus pakistanensis]